jgi:hypothetical protein
LNWSVFLLFFILACSQVNRIGLKRHSFSAQPRKIIWLQVDGFDLSHLGLFQFSELGKTNRSELEDFLCLGKAWEFNLNTIAPTAQVSMANQLQGSVSLAKGCSQFENLPYWSSLNQEKNFEVLFVQEGAAGFSLEALNKCEKKQNWFNGITQIDRELNPEGAKYHPSQSTVLSRGGLYVDQSCQQESGCFTELSQVVDSIRNTLFKNTSKFVIHIQDFSYAKHLKSKNYKEVVRKLEDYANIKKSLEQNYKEEELLFLITGSKSMSILFPESGGFWKDFYQKKISLPNYPSGSIPVLATGARAENFCGIFHQEDLLKRMFFFERKTKLGL